jgi:hypothetical protein
LNGNWPQHFDVNQTGVKKCDVTVYGPGGQSSCNGSINVSGGFHCTGNPLPQGATQCSRDTTGLSSNTPWPQVNTCTNTRKCEYTIPPANNGPQCGTCTTLYLSATSWNNCSFCAPGKIVGTPPSFSSSASWKCIKDGKEKNCGVQMTYCMQKMCAANGTCQSSMIPASSLSQCQNTCNSDVDCSMGELIETKP